MGGREALPSITKHCALLVRRRTSTSPFFSTGVSRFCKNGNTIPLIRCRMQGASHIRRPIQNHGWSFTRMMDERTQIVEVVPLGTRMKDGQKTAGLIALSGKSRGQPRLPSQLR